MRINSIISSLICAALSFMACAQDNVFEQPAVEARVNIPDLAQRIDSVVDGRITGIDRRAGWPRWAAPRRRAWKASPTRFAAPPAGWPASCSSC